MKKRGFGILFFLMVCLVAGCGNKEQGNTQDTPTPTLTPFVPEIVGTYEAEDGVLAGNVKVVNDSSRSGTGYVKGFEKEGDSCTMTVKIEQEGFYDLVFRIASNGGEKTNPVSVDGSPVGNIYVKETSYIDDSIERVWFTPGEHTVSVGVSWGWFFLDFLTIQTSEPLDPSLYELEAK
mgnify:FL=1